MNLAKWIDCGGGICAKPDSMEEELVPVCLFSERPQEEVVRLIAAAPEVLTMLIWALTRIDPATPGYEEALSVVANI